MRKTPKRKTSSEAVPFKKLQIEYVPIERLKPWVKNPRKNDDAAERLADLLGAHGFVVPIIATRDGTVRAGHTRLKAAKLKGMKAVPVIWIDFDSEEDAELFSIAENRSHEWSEWDQNMLRDVFGELLEAHPDRAPRMAGLTPIEIEGLALSAEAPRTFEEAAAKFERDARADGMEDEWVWLMVPNKKTVDSLAKRYGRSPGKKGTKRELDWEKIRGRLLGPERKVQ